MKKIKSFLYAAATCFLIFILIIDSKTAIRAACEGVQMCLNIVIPSLFPISVLSAMLTMQTLGKRCKCTDLIAKLCKMPPGTESIFITGLISGYPIGAKNTLHAHKNGCITTQQTQRLLMFCSNCGPAFIFGICMPMFSSKTSLWLLWLIQILSALLVANINGSPDAKAKSLPKQSTSITAVLTNSLQAMAVVSGWIILFNILITFLDTWFLFAIDPAIGCTIKCILELTNGIVSLKHIANEGLRFIICAAALSFGGICIAMQTATLAASIGTKTYIIGKLQQTIISLILSAIVYFFAYFKQTGTIVTAIILVIFCFLFIFLQKSVEISRNIIYNMKKMRRGSGYVVS